MNSNQTGKNPVKDLESVMKRLRSPDGCPWDREQTHESLCSCLMEECGEFVDSAEAGDDAGMLEELGDLLMHVVLHSVMAEERGAFTLEDVARVSAEKMRRRHPHVFAGASVRNADDVNRLWEQVKREEKAAERESILDGIPRHPALLQAEKMQKRVAKYGFDWSDEAQILDKIDEEFRELRESYAENNPEHTDEELGDLLFVITNLARFRKRASSEDLLADTNDKFMRRFRHIEKKLKQSGVPLEKATLEQMEALWNDAKKVEKTNGMPS